MNNRERQYGRGSELENYYRKFDDEWKVILIRLHSNFQKSFENIVFDKHKTLG